MIRGDNRPDIDRRLLEATLRQTSLHPSVSVALSLEVALLQAARDYIEIRVEDEPTLAGRQYYARLMVMDRGRESEEGGAK